MSTQSFSGVSGKNSGKNSSLSAGCKNNVIHETSEDSNSNKSQGIPLYEDIKDDEDYYKDGDDSRSSEER